MPTRTLQPQLRSPITAGRTQAVAGREPPVARAVLDRAVAALGREALPLATCALLAAALLASLPAQLVQDSWLALVAGREIVESGLPARNDLTLFAAGSPWIDQQWLGQLVVYGLHEAGGTRLLLLTNAAVTVGSLAAAVALARRAGGAPPVVAGVVLATAFAAPWSWQLRPQTLAYPLFVALVGLLVADGRRPSARVLLVLPTLALWANVHGSVVLGSALVCVSALAALARPRARLRYAFLAAAAPASVFASPYAADLVAYYGDTLGRGAFAALVSEWRPAWAGAATIPFLVLAAAALVVTVLRRRAATTTDVAVVLTTTLAGLLAARNVVWFALAAVAVVPSLVRTTRASRGGRLHLALAAAAAAGVLATAALVAARPASWYESAWSPHAAAVVAEAADRDPELRVLASERTADWLLWHVPALAGRVAFDARFELLRDDELYRIAALLDGREPTWRTEARGFGLVVVEPRRERLLRAVLSEPGARLLARDARAVVVLRAGEPAA